MTPIKANLTHLCNLMSFCFLFRLNEVEDFSPLTFPPNQEQHCDILVEKPTIFMKLDAGLLLHFCSCYDFQATGKFLCFTLKPNLKTNMQKSLIAYREKGQCSGENDSLPINVAS